MKLGVFKRKHIDWPQKTSKCHKKKLKAIRLENRNVQNKCKTNGIKTGVSVCDRTINSHRFIKILDDFLFQ